MTIAAMEKKQCVLCVLLSYISLPTIQKVFIFAQQCFMTKLSRRVEKKHTEVFM